MAETTARSGGEAVQGPPAASVRALLSNIIDYAGLFPPAGLDMQQTVESYAAYLAGADAWMLERLVVPVARLEEFEASARELLPGGGAGEDEEPWPVAALTAAAGTAELEADLGRIARFNAVHVEPGRGLALIDVIELKAPSARAVEQGLERIPDEVYPFFEIPLAGDPRGFVAALAGSEAGAKVRTGGAGADRLPTAAQLARFVALCAAAEVPFKATAGLHHPLSGARGAGGEPGAAEFGFLNLFLAAALALCAELPEAGVRAVLEETAGEAFGFDEDGATWRGRHLEVEQIDAARLTFAISFGSCSFDEPREGLRGLKLL